MAVFGLSWVCVPLPNIHLCPPIFVNPDNFRVFILQNLIWAQNGFKKNKRDYKNNLFFMSHFLEIDKFWLLE